MASRLFRMFFQEKYELKSFSFSLPFQIGSMTIQRTMAQEKAAWSLYVEYATRIATQQLEPGTGSIREALSSLRELFSVTRSVLKEQGPEVAEGTNSVGPLAIRILNEGVRPFLVRWHTRLRVFERAQAGQASGPLDESLWEESEAFYKELAELQGGLDGYVEALAILAGIHNQDRR